MERELFRAKEVASQEYIISDSIAWLEGKLHLLVCGRWMECKEETRSVSYPDMLDKNGERIFAALNDSGVGGSTLKSSWWKGADEPHNQMRAIYFEREFRFIGKHINRSVGRENVGNDCEVTGIYKG